MRFEDPQWELLEPDEPTGIGVLLLAGSSGRVDSQRARVLRAHGAVVLAIRWFGGPRQQPGPFGVPLELFTGALDRLEPLADAVAGTSFGGEAALLTAGLDPRVRATVGFAASSVVWPGWSGHEWTSHWTWRGESNAAARTCLILGGATAPSSRASPRSPSLVRAGPDQWFDGALPGLHQCDRSTACDDATEGSWSGWPAGSSRASEGDSARRC